MQPFFVTLCFLRFCSRYSYVQRELLEIGENLSDVEEDDELDPNPSRVPGGGKERAISQKKKQRRKNISDRTASLFYRMKAVTSRNFSAAI
ncbi:hypothetical protein BSL78_21595 [Apostichopus japonicus]|uniref:Uncharacterized protein n=1 Tax=Stichopus japonicus TaxID=307972 RepID=A0A2G8K0M3_STIJA|nr:hypothetical protein BSL78_21595 [Apostichopus japonicus]